MKNEITFTKVDLSYGWLGNMSPYPIEYDGKTWRTSEALFQALRFEDEEIREIIRGEKSPMGAKMKAKKHKELMSVIPMSEKDVENMKMCVKLKIDQHENIRFRLKATGTSKIIEDIGKRNGERHKFWGAKKVDGKWIGDNVMGKIWMEFRKEII
ncbi:NADAR family protein [Bacteroidota bacterium]